MLQSHSLASVVAGSMFVLALAPVRLLAQSKAESSATGAQLSCPERCTRQGRWYIVETENFQACCQDSESTASLLARSAEDLRVKLQSKWLGDESLKSWNPKCQIVLHPSLESYVVASGRGSEHTVGTSLVKRANGQIVSRQIDLLGGRDDFLSAALPHELTHVVLKDRFPDDKLPRWADEGIASLADSEAKQGRHLRDLEDGIANHTLFDTASLVALTDYPGSNRIALFYGQSISLVKFMVDEKDPQQFVEFIERAGAKGYDVALRECYGLHDVRQLDRLWSNQLHLVSAPKSGEESRKLAAK